MNAGYAYALFMAVASIVILMMTLELKDEVNIYRNALIQSHKNYRAALEQNTELRVCRDTLAMVKFAEVVEGE